jgi:hypothetical protein
VARPAVARASGVTTPDRDARGFFGQAAATSERDLYVEKPVVAREIREDRRNVVARADSIAPVAPIKPRLPGVSHEESVIGGASIKESDLVVAHESAVSQTFDELAGAEDDSVNAAEGNAGAVLPEGEDNDSFARGSLGWDDGAAANAPVTEEPSVAALNKVSGSADCLKAEEEIGRVTAETDTADKLFHYRRALRLCPDNAAYHNGLGEVYLSLNRSSDAEFEFREALRVDPRSRQAQKNLDSIKSR